MASPASPSDSGAQDSVGTDPRVLMAQEFLVLIEYDAKVRISISAYIASLLTLRRSR